MPRLLIVGCGRSGTRYISKVLCRAGLGIGHEKPGNDGMANWMSVAIPDDISSYDVIWHQVRHPLGVIASFGTVMERTWRFIYEKEPRILPDDAVLLRCMKYWLYWNQRCEDCASLSYRVENLRVLLPSFLERLGLEPTKDVVAESLKVPTNDHTRRQGHRVSSVYPKLVWADLVRQDASIAAQVRAQAQGYGYDFAK
jgi:hypothetical protein